MATLPTTGEPREQSSRYLAPLLADLRHNPLLWLLLFGLIHGYFIWGGDILFPYAMMGLLLYPLRKLSARALLSAAAASRYSANVVWISFSMPDRSSSCFCKVVSNSSSVAR